MILCQGRVPFGKIYCKPGIQEQYFSDTEMLAAAELRFYLSRMTVAPFETVDYENDDADGFYLGSVSGLSAEGLGDDGFRIVCGNGKVRIQGGKRGLFYAVYDFLETLGCRFFTPTVEKIPLKTILEVEAYTKEDHPVFEYREMDYADVTQNPYHCLKMRLNGHYQNIDDEFGGCITYASHAHSFSWMVPVEKYGKEHPEYYSLFEGKRMNHPDDYWQLCLTNPEVLDIATESVRKYLLEHPKASIISISQNDNLNRCQCENCRKADEEEGSPSGTLLRFVNAIAERLEGEFPNVLFDILAYHYTRPASALTRARHNVCVRLCASTTCYSHPYDQCPDRSRAIVHPNGKKSVFFDDLQDWSRVCDRLYIWDYTTNFQLYPMPFANWEVLQKNLQILRDYHVKGVFEEANRATGGGVDFNDLRCYLFSKLLWNPDCDVEALAKEFLVYVCGDAAPYLEEYLKLLCENNRKSGHHLYIQDRARPPYLSDECMAEYNRLFDQAEAAVAGDGLRLQHVQRYRLSLRFAEVYWKITADGEYDAQRIHDLFDDFHTHGILKLDEWCCVQKTYRALMDKRTDGGRWYTPRPVSDWNELF